MDGPQVLCTIFAAIISLGLSGADHEHMVKNVEPITVPLDFETKLECVMNIPPDKYGWKFYRLPAKDAFNPKASINLSKSNSVLIPPHNNTKQKESDHTIQVTSLSVAGDYQCLAYYGASVVASVPWRITIATLKDFPKQDNINITVVAGNTINWRCNPPESNPEAYIDYLKNEQYIPATSTTIATKSLILPNVTSADSGRYKCRAINSLGGTKNSPTTLNLRVSKNGPLQRPSFVIAPKTVYTVTEGESVFLECAAVGNPIPKVVWAKMIGEIPKNRADMVDGGLIIKNVSSSDDGVYICKQENSQGHIEQEITLIYNEPPSINCLLNSTEVKQEEKLDLDCQVLGTPEPQVSWFLNGFSVTNDSAIEAIGNTIYFTKVEKRHAGTLQIFARNSVKTVYSSISIRVIPLTSSIDVSAPPTRPRSRHNPKHPRKHTKMILPSKPNVTRLNDGAVVVRWLVPANKGLQIQFFKVQYRELAPPNQPDHHGRGSKKWQTTNADIPPHIRSYEVNNLNSDHWYRFRIAAVYSNSDNRNSPNSDKFHLRRLDFAERNPLPVPLITRTEPVNTTSVKIYWKYEPSPNITVDGFFINYNSASSAGDYMKATVDGKDTNSYILSHLNPDTVYDIKLQSFTSKTASVFSAIMKARTFAEVSTTSPSSTETTGQPAGAAETGGISKLYIIIAAAVIVGGAVILAVALLLFCRKWKQKKNSNRDDRDKSAVEDRHIQADSNDYVVAPKNLNRANGCVPPSRITITANPLADADNKNQNMIEMSCLSSQNNNCSSTAQPSASSEGGSPTSTGRDKKNKSREKRVRNKHNSNNAASNNTDSNNSGENYV